MNRTTRILLTALTVATLGAGVASADTPAPRLEHRHARQHERIERGVKSGQITRQELRRLRRAEAKMRRTEARLRRTEARLRADRLRLERERVRLHCQLDRQSERIWRMKHNGWFYVL
jgi:hypothetical protein